MRKYLEAVESLRASFTPFVQSMEVVLGQEAHSIMRRMAEQLSLHWERLYSTAMSWMHTRLFFFTTIRATDLCVRDSRVKCWSVAVMEDGVDLPLFLC